MKVKLIHSEADPVRLAFCHVFSAREGMTRDDGTKGDAKFEVTPILKPGGANEKRVIEAITEVAKEKWGEKPVKDGDSTIPNYRLVLRSLDEDRRGLRDGNLKRTPSGDIYDGFEGMKYVTARNKKRPGVFDLDTTPLVEADGRPYAGCYGNVNVDVWALKKQGVKPCIVVDLEGVQFVKDGDAFGGGSAPSKADDFENLSAADDGGDNSSGEDAEDPFA